MTGDPVGQTKTITDEKDISIYHMPGGPFAAACP